MLSRIDIEKELGKQINIFPLHMKNFKDNSINLCVGRYAWALQDGKVYFDSQTQRFSRETTAGAIPFDVKRGESAIFSQKSKYYVALLPHSTTLIETKEVLAVGASIGGTYHSKVGMVSQGLGHIGTMLGPNFSGFSLITIHNMTDDVITLNGGESFVSVVFHYLNTPIHEKNATVSGHVDKMAELGVHLTAKERADLSEDWCGKIESVRERMMQTDEYKDFQKALEIRKKEKWRKYITWRSIVSFLSLMALLAVLEFAAYQADKINNTTQWMSAYISFISSTVMFTIISSLIKTISGGAK